MKTRKEMKTIVNKALVSLLLISLSACTGNTVFFNLKKQSVLTCSGKNIVDFEIKTNSQTYQFHMKSNVKDQNEIVLGNLMNNNFVVRSYPDFSDTIFILKPNEEYVFTNRSVGDATASRIFFLTDKSRKVIKANKLSCK